MQKDGLKDIPKSELEQAAQFAAPDPKAILDSAQTADISQLKISEDASTEAVKKYFNEVHRLAYTEAFRNVRETDIIPFIKFLKFNSPDELKNIDPVLDAITSGISSLNNLSVPRGYEDFTIKELNFFYKIKRADEILRQADKDLIKATAIVRPRFDLEDELNNFHSEYKRILLDKGIKFNPSEEGYKLFP